MGRIVRSGNMFMPSLISAAVDTYLTTYGVDPNYIVMNEETLDAVKAGIHPMIYVEEPKYPVYCGVPIAICGKLRFGEFEVV